MLKEAGIEPSNFPKNVCDMRMQLFQIHGYNKKEDEKEPEKAPETSTETSTETSIEEPKPKKSRLSESSSENSKDHFTGISNDILVTIFRFLDGSSLGRSISVCHKWKDVISKDDIWKDLFMNTWNSKA